MKVKLIHIQIKADIKAESDKVIEHIIQVTNENKHLTSGENQLRNQHKRSQQKLQSRKSYNLADETHRKIKISASVINRKEAQIY